MINKYKIKIIGKDTRRFVLNLISKKISLYHMENHPKYSIIIVDEDGYKYISRLKTSYKLVKLRSYGFAHITDVFKKYSIFIMSIVLGIIIIKTLSFVVFDIEVQHQKSNIRQMILDDLNEFGINKYHFIVSNKKKEEIKKKILNKERNSIEWLEIERIGTKYVVKVEERIKDKVNKKKNKQSIIAKKDAMILSISASHGEVVKKKYDYVKKGDVIISGIIKNKEENMAKVTAEGKVYGEIWYKVKVNIPKKYKEIEKTGNSKKSIEVNFFNKSIFILPNNYKNYKVDRKVLLKNKIIPFSINYSNVEEIHEFKKKYNMNNIENDALKIGEKKLKNKLGKKDSVIYKKVLKKYEKNSKIEVDIFFKTKEDITDTVSIENIKLSEYKEGGNSESNE